MHKRSHALLALSLLRCENGFSARRYEWAFLLGSFQPDCNPLSYLKGSLHGKRFGGHTYGNSRGYINRHIRRLQRRKRWHMWQYYTMGKLTHYVADAFTWPHNPDFPGNALAHHVYERKLRFALEESLSGAVLLPGAARGVRPSLPEELEDLHRRYLAEEETGTGRDIRYILMASDLLMAGCRPAGQTEGVSLSAPEREGIGDFAESFP